MDLTRASLRNPAAVAVVVALVAVFGLIACSSCRCSCSPTSSGRRCRCRPSWRAASPQEMESEIVEPIEAVLQGLPGSSRWTRTSIPATAGST